MNSFKSIQIPSSPGVYLFRDKFGSIIYIGKATNLRRRMSFYFKTSSLRSSNPKIRALINSIDSYEITTVKNETEALILESKLIKEYAPYYNTLLRDDKRFFLIKINKNEKFQRLTLTRVRRNDGNMYFGPFPNGMELKPTIEYLSSYFKIRTCTIEFPDSATRKYCMEARVKKCSEPCVGKITSEEYSEQINKVIKVLEGKSSEFLDKLKDEMNNYSSRLEFEKSAKIRDIIDNIKSLFLKNVNNFKYKKIGNNLDSSSNIDLQKILKIKKVPIHIECIDISNISEKTAVASIITFRGSSASRKEYRQFRIKTVTGNNDYAMIQEALTRHYLNLKKDDIPVPDLLVIDGGKGQLSSAISALTNINVSPFPVISLAKKREEIFIPGQALPIVLDKNNSALKLLMAVRDEAHRFAISYARKLRNKKLTESILDSVTGIGEKRKQQLLLKFGSVASLKKQSPEAIHTEIKGISLALAKKILTTLK